MDNIIISQPIKLDENIVNVYKGNIFLYDFEKPKIEQKPITITDDSNIVVKHYPTTFDETLEINDKTNIIVETQFDENFKITDEIKISLVPKVTKLDFEDYFEFNDSTLIKVNRIDD